VVGGTTMRWLAGTSIAFAVAACLAEPRFEVREGDAQVDDAMVLVDGAPAPVLLREEDDRDGKGKRKGPGPSPGPAPEPDKGDRDAAVPNRDAGVTAQPPSGSAAESARAPFWIDIREVAQRDFAACVSSHACAAAACAAPSPDHPVACVTRDQARAYCGWRKKRLVRDEEWSRAAGADTFPWGNAGPSATRLQACGSEDACTTAPRGSHPEGATRNGVLDLAGNVAEWVDADVPIVRGGSFADADPAAFSTSSRRTVDASVRDPTIGFRCARDP
jgi:hypothetical protein